MATDFSSKKLTKTYAEGVIAEELSLKPIILKLVGNTKNKKVLDLGCGDGRYSVIFAKQGADVIAIDASAHQIDIAKKVNHHPNIKYIRSDISNLSLIGGNSIDVIFMNMVIPDLDGQKKLQKTFSEASRILKRNGKFIFSTLHPLYLSPEQDISDKAINFKKRNYFKEGSNYKASAITKFGNKMVFNETHFSLSYISKLIMKNNLIIKLLTESKQVPSKDIFLPKYIVIECEK